MSLTITGKIVNILSLESGTSKSGKEWKKQAFVLDTGAQFNPLVCFSLFGDEKINMLRDFGAGQEVEVAFNISSREFNGRWYHNIDAWKISGAGQQAASPNASSEAPLPTIDEAPAEDDDLPF
ncbi:MAG: DUF3127 domain-containing protein [Flavobacteriales bacterium]|nr:DUF3127 domain-containing protein [Flavobacteriales bacterium]